MIVAESVFYFIVVGMCVGYYNYIILFGNQIGIFYLLIKYWMNFFSKLVGENSH